MACWCVILTKRITEDVNENVFGGGEGGLAVFWSCLWSFVMDQLVAALI